jgi:hypothetical protein
MFWKMFFKLFMVLKFIFPGIFTGAGIGTFSAYQRVASGSVEPDLSPLLYKSKTFMRGI